MLDNPVGRTALVMINAALSGIVFLLFFLFSNPVTALTLKYAVVGIVGLTAGFTARRFLGHNTGVLRLIAAITASITGLIVLNIFSLGFVGVDLARRGTATPDWDGLIQLGVGTLCAILSLQAWKYKKPQISTPSEPRERRRLRLLPSGVENWLERASLRISGATSSAQRSGGSRVSLRTHSSSNGNAGRTSLVKRQRRPKVFAWARRQHTNQVHLDTKEEHRCPFCLEVVDENDPRGIKICPICHTYHHADCWDVTGMCQIPHIQD